MSRIALNLGGGAARGFAHIGIIRALIENDIRISHIVGISMGAIVGGVYATMPNVDFLEKRMRQMVDFEAFSDSIVGTWTNTQETEAKGIVRRAQKLVTSTNILRRMFTASGVLSFDDVHAVLDPFLANIAIESTEIPFATAAVNIRDGALRVFQGKDRLRNAVIASASMPLIFPPEKIGKDYFVDGGVLDKLGIDAAASIGINNPIVVDVSDEKLPDTLPHSAFDVILKTEEIASEHRRKLQLEKASLVLRPIRGNFHWADYSAVTNFIEMGYECAHENIRAIQHIASGRRLFALFR
ncbi:MAG TPA: patatin-like phospholipase family protein [Turneriella sp.]|nr:patatin-like phospholipase family protein [Turneriella sp.]